MVFLCHPNEVPLVGGMRSPMPIKEVAKRQPLMGKDFFQAA